MLHNCLSRTERPRYRSCSSFSKRKHRINYSLSCCQRFVWRELFDIRSLNSYRPFLNHRNIIIVPVFICYGSNCLIDRKASALNFLDDSFYILWDHYSVFYSLCLLNCSDYVAHLYLVAHRSFGNKIPFFLMVQCRFSNSSFYIGTTFFD